MMVPKFDLKKTLIELCHLIKIKKKQIAGIPAVWKSAVINATIRMTHLSVIVKNDGPSCCFLPTLEQ